MTDVDMADDLEILEFLEADNSETRERRLTIMQRRLAIRLQEDVFNILDNLEFIKRYRLPKNLVRSLCDELRPHISQPLKSTDLTVETKVLTALSFYATGSYQRPTGNIAAHSIAQTTVSKALAEVTRCLNLPQIRTKYIRFPQNERERRETALKFYNKFAIPGVIGCIDCTHVGIVRPKEHEERFYCRKQYHSLNVQLICNADMDIISVDASHGGATHDAFIWDNHPLKSHLDEISRNEAVWFLGDSGYPQRRYMMTPILNAPLGSPEAHYTFLHVRARNIIERTIGLLKARYRCLLVHRILHYSPHVAASIVNACVILHNICNKANVIVQELSDEEAANELQSTSAFIHHPQNSSTLETTTPTSSLNNNLQDGLRTRQILINRLQSSNV